jgi:hypothetical protein
VQGKLAVTSLKILVVAAAALASIALVLESISIISDLK